MKAQLAMLACGALLLAVLPPAEGRLLLIPIGHTSQADLANAALGSGAPVLAAGPYPGSLIVHGRRRAIEQEPSHGAMLILAAPTLDCGFDVSEAVL